MRCKSIWQFLIIVSLFASCNDAVEPYVSPERVMLAIGPVQGLPPEQVRAFTYNADFDPLPKPGENDWLAIHKEPGQTYRQFVAAGPNWPGAPRNVIYLQPLDNFTGRDPNNIETLKVFAEAFFQLPVVLQAPVDVTQYGITERKNPSAGHRQLLSSDILEFLERAMPDDAWCRLGVTTIDLYPEPSWNFVFGQASLSNGTGGYSFARYEPAFYGQSPKPGDEQLALLRSFKVLAHETAHMFGIQHCIYLHCVMNGSNNLEETDASPVHLCPVCLRKLHHSAGFDIAQRYSRLETVYRQANLPEEADWVQRRAAYVRGE